MFHCALGRLPKRALAAAATISPLLIGAAGCASWGFGGSSSGSGSIETASVASDPAGVLMPDIKCAIYRQRSGGTATIIVSDLTAEQLANGEFVGPCQIVCIDLLWSPKAGRTPMDSSATNCTIRHIVFTGQGVEMGVYGGGGYLKPTTKVGRSTFKGSITSSALKMTQATPGFADLLGACELLGSFSAAENREMLSACAVSINSEVSRRLDRLCLVVSD